MSILNKLPYRTIWAVDFEYGGGDGNIPLPRCLVAKELRSGRIIRVWEDELLRMRKPPYPTDPTALFVAYYSSAEINCHRALGWSIPKRIFDIFTEWRATSNGLDIYVLGRKIGNSLLDAMSAFELDTLPASEKSEMRELAIRGGPWSIGEPQALLDYCQSDVECLEELMLRILPLTLGQNFGTPYNVLPYALIRGRYMAAASYVEHNGLPIDVPLLNHLRARWGYIIDQLISEVDGPFGLFEERSSRTSRFRNWLLEHNIAWPKLSSGKLDLEEDTFRDMVKRYPILTPIHELRTILSSMRLEKLQVGDDGRNRVMLSAYRATTGRDQPSNSKFIFGPATWLRGLIKPGPGDVFVYIDWSSQEIGIGAALSGDECMMEDYLSGDFYLTFAKRIELVPSHATVEMHSDVREIVKTTVLGVGYGMGAYSLSHRLGVLESEEKGLINVCWKTYPKYAAWLEGAVNFAMLNNCLPTVFGWPIHIEGRYNPIKQNNKPNPRSLRNFPCQANGAEMLRLAICLATERGIKVVAPVHDAIAIESKIGELEENVRNMQETMVEASEIVLNGFRLRTKAEVVLYPNRYYDKRGTAMWDRVMGLLPDDSLSRSSNIG